VEAGENAAILTGEAEDASARVDEIVTAGLRPQGRYPHQETHVDPRTPGELLRFIGAKGREVADSLAILRRSRNG
jgi:hypothetical protein